MVANYDYQLDLAGNRISTTEYTYNELGRMASVTEITYVDSVAQTKTKNYEYNTQGLRVTEVLTAADGEVARKVYLFDTQNPTGYAQVLNEYINDQLAYVYTLGHDVLSVAKDAGVEDASGNTTATAYHLLTDGHGSTRLLASLSATTIAISQQYLYNAYGEMLSSDHLATATNALTTLLYSGEWTNPNGTQYLRARSYDPSTGRFNRLDPFAGNQNDPQSLHKYLYTHANPIMGVDPTGEGLVIEALAAVSIATMLIAIPLYYNYSSTRSLALSVPRTVIINIYVNKANEPRSHSVDLWEVQNAMISGIQPKLNPIGSRDKVVIRIKRDYGSFNLSDLGWIYKSHVKNQWNGYVKFNPKFKAGFATTKGAVTTVSPTSVNGATLWHEWMYPNMFAHEQLYLGAFGGSDNDQKYGTGFSLNTRDAGIYQNSNFAVPIDLNWLADFREYIEAK